jgi:hypothetical protein
MPRLDAVEQLNVPPCGQHGRSAEGPLHRCAGGLGLAGSVLPWLVLPLDVSLGDQQLHAESTSARSDAQS